MLDTLVHMWRVWIINTALFTPRKHLNWESLILSPHTEQVWDQPAVSRVPCWPPTWETGCSAPGCLRFRGIGLKCLQEWSCFTSTSNCRPVLCSYCFPTSVNGAAVHWKRTIWKCRVTCFLGGGFKVGVAVWFLQANGGQNHSTSLR